VNAVLQHINAGKLRALAVTSAKRSSVLPQVPTMKEAGVNGAEVASWQAMVAPKGLPVDIKAKIHAAVVGALQDESLKSKLVSQALKSSPTRLSNLLSTRLRNSRAGKK